MDKDDCSLSDGFILFIVMIISCFASTFITKSINDRIWTNQAIEHNTAHFDQKTGVFRWNE